MKDKEEKLSKAADEFYDKNNINPDFKLVVSAYLFSFAMSEPVKEYWSSPQPDSTTEDMKVKCENCEQTITPVRLGGFCPECFQDI